MSPLNYMVDFQVLGAVGRRQGPLTSLRARKDIPCANRGTQFPMALSGYVHSLSSYIGCLKVYIVQHSTCEAIHYAHNFPKLAQALAYPLHYRLHYQILHCTTQTAE